MFRRKYDFVFGLGPACSCSQSLRAAGLQLTSLPFDWNGMQSVPDRQRLLETDFRDWLNREDFAPVGENVLGRRHVWINCRTKCVYAHDFLSDEITDAQVRVVEEKYRRRIDRMFRLIGNSRRVLAVWVQVDRFPRPTDAEWDSFRRFLMDRWSGVSFDLLVFDWVPDVPETNAQDVSKPGLRRVSFDYRDRSQDRWFADYDVLGRWLKRRYAVCDYRTEEEKRVWRRGEREKKFARFGVSSRIGYFFARTAYALKKHLAKARRGT